MRQITLLFVIFLFLPKDTSATIELCGNKNSSGVFVACPGADKDNDGYNSTSDGGVDCDDTDYRIYPGVVTTSGCPSGQTRTCQSNGSFTSCSANVVCEATAGSNCKYIDCGSGNDTSGNGSYNSPWKSFANVSYYDNASLKPANWHNIQPGDVIYLKGSGTCNQTTNTGSNNKAMFKLNKSGTAGKPITIKRYPGSTAVITAPFSSSNRGKAFDIWDLSYLKLDDLEFANGYDLPIYLAGVGNAEVSRVTCRSVPGYGYDNHACINLVSTDAGNYLHHNEIYDLYDPDRPENLNISAIVIFDGTNNRVEYNRIYYTNSPGYAGGVKGQCFKYKHPATSGSSTFIGNQLKNCFHTAIENSAYGLIIKNNLFVNPSDYSNTIAYHCGDIGKGISYCKNIVIENNTFVNAGAYRMAESINAGLGNTSIRKNVFIDNATYYSGERCFFRIETYGSNASYNAFIAANAITSDNNCYYNPNIDLKFDIFSDSGIGGSLGGFYTFSSWKSTFNNDLNSRFENPNLDSNYRATNANCASYGWRSGSSSTNKPNPPSGLSASEVP